jgi:hypothetical protein
VGTDPGPNPGCPSSWDPEGGAVRGKGERGLEVTAWTRSGPDLLSSHVIVTISMDADQDLPFYLNVDPDIGFVVTLNIDFCIFFFLIFKFVLFYVPERGSHSLVQ